MGSQDQMENADPLGANLFTGLNQNTARNKRKAMASSLIVTRLCEPAARLIYRTIPFPKSIQNPTVKNSGDRRTSAELKRANIRHRNSFSSPILGSLMSFQRL